MAFIPTLFATLAAQQILGGPDKDVITPENLLKTAATVYVGGEVLPAAFGGGEASNVISTSYTDGAPNLLGGINPKLALAGLGIAGATSQPNFSPKGTTEEESESLTEDFVYRFPSSGAPTPRLGITNEYLGYGMPMFAARGGIMRYKSGKEVESNKEEKEKYKHLLTLNKFAQGYNTARLNPDKTLSEMTRSSPKFVEALTSTEGETLPLDPSTRGLNPYMAATKSLSDLQKKYKIPSVFAAAEGGRLGSFSDDKSPNLLDGPGDGVSDNIPAMIEGEQPALLADGEYVIPARIVSELGNGSTKAGADVLDKMVERIQGVRKETIGKDNVAVDTDADKMLPV